MIGLSRYSGAQSRGDTKEKTSKGIQTWRKQEQGNILNVGGSSRESVCICYTFACDMDKKMIVLNI